MTYGDGKLEEKLKEISNEVKIKRDSFPANSEGRRYYRGISKNLDMILKKIKIYKDGFL